MTEITGKRTAIRLQMIRIGWRTLPHAKFQILRGTLAIEVSFKKEVSFFRTCIRYKQFFNNINFLFLMWTLLWTHRALTWLPSCASFREKSRRHLTPTESTKLYSFSPLVFRRDKITSRVVRDKFSQKKSVNRESSFPRCQQWEQGNSWIEVDPWRHVPDFSFPSGPPLSGKTYSLIKL